MERLDKFLCDSGVGTRSQVKPMIKAGRVTVDGVPVNMVSHAHGQGYADLHFLQPEAIETIDFDKGPYNAQKGDLATAGYVAFKTKDRIANEATVEIGQFNTQRYHLSY